jgi:hypothetical protein
MTSLRNQLEETEDEGSSRFGCRHRKDVIEVGVEEKA